MYLLVIYRSLFAWAYSCKINIYMFSSNAQTITKIQMITGLLSIAGLFYFDFTLSNIILLLVSFYVYSVIGVGLTLHRYYSHKSFEFRFEFIKWICTLIAILSGRASILGWVYVHRLHHAYSDTEKDPHGPGNIGFKLFNFKHIESTAGKMNVFLVKDLMNKQHIFIHDYYLAIILAFVFVQYRQYSSSPEVKESLLASLVNSLQNRTISICFLT